MGRSTKKGVDYFQHDTDASEKTTLFALEAKYGNDGYAFWFKLLELLGKKDTAAIDCSDNNEWYYLLHKMRMEGTQVDEILGLLSNLKAIDPDLWTQHRIIWSDNFVARLNVVYSKRKEGAPLKPMTSQPEPPIPETPTEPPITEKPPEHSVTEKPISESDIPISVTEKGISVTEKLISVTEKRESESDIVGPFDLTEEDIRRSMDMDEAIETTARRNGFRLHEAGMLKARDLAATYGLDKLLEAIKIAGLGASQTWRYVEGILKKEAARHPPAPQQPTPSTWDVNPYAEYEGANQ